MVQLSLATAFVAANAIPQLAWAASGLNTAAKAAGLKYFGTAVDNSDLSDSQYVSGLASNDFGQLTPANSMKWDAIEPSQNTFSYTGGDQIVSLAQGAGRIMRCHNLVWHNQLPSWVTGGTWTNSTLTAVLKNHIANEAGHYKGKCYAWDVVNEALNDDGTMRTADPFSTIIGPAFIPMAFAAAAAADPAAKLYYNDYNIESPGAKATAAQNLVKMVQAYGAKIDGVGLQSHFIVGSTPSTSSQKTNMAAFTALGVEVAITELDIRMTLPSTAALLAQQGTDYVSTVNACLQTKNCVGITIWDWTDKYSWVPSTFSGQGAALPWDANYQPKPCYTSMLSALNAAATSVSSPGGGTTTTTTSAPSKTTTTSAPGTTTSSSSGATQTQWGQCGGTGWAGATACASPYTCHTLNPYYSQCY